MSENETSNKINLVLEDQVPCFKASRRGRKGGTLVAETIPELIKQAHDRGWVGNLIVSRAYTKRTQDNLFSNESENV